MNNEEFRQFRDTRYYVSNMGKVAMANEDHTDLKRLPESTVSSGYKQVDLGGQKFYVHRMVLEVFDPTPMWVVEEDNLQGNHLDGNPANNAYDNVQWSTGSKNIQHAIDAGLWKPRHNKSRATGRPCFYTDSQIELMRKMYNKLNFTQVAIAEMFDTCQSTVSRVVRGIYRPEVAQ